MQRRLNDGRSPIVRCQVAESCRRLPAAGFDFRSDSLPSGLIASMDDNLHTLCGKHPGDLGSDAGTAAGNERALTL